MEGSWPEGSPKRDNSYPERAHMIPDAYTIELSIYPIERLSSFGKYAAVLCTSWEVNDNALERELVHF